MKTDRISSKFNIYAGYVINRDELHKAAIEEFNKTQGLRGLFKSVTNFNERRTAAQLFATLTNPSKMFEIRMDAQNIINEINIMQIINGNLDIADITNRLSKTEARLDRRIDAIENTLDYLRGATDKLRYRPAGAN
jgi:hypothetical protein